jgi:hypothetical protein
VARLSDGSRKVVEISEARGIGADGAVALQPIYLFERTGVAEDGRVQGSFRAAAETAFPRRRAPMSEAIAGNADEPAAAGAES